MPWLVAKADPARILRVVERIVRGLFWVEQERRVPDGSVIQTRASLEGGNEAFFDANASVLAFVAPGDVRTIGGDVFAYWHTTCEGDRDLTVWLSVFYDRFGFLSLVVPREYADELKRKSVQGSTPSQDERLRAR